MTPEQFCYWLQGFTELSPETKPNDSQWRSIIDHLKTVFTKATPELGVKRPEWPLSRPMYGPYKFGDNPFDKGPICATNTSYSSGVSVNERVDLFSTFGDKPLPPLSSIKFEHQD